MYKCGKRTNNRDKPALHGSLKTGAVQKNSWRDPEGPGPRGAKGIKEMENKNKFSSMWKGKGFYIALGVCVFAAVISSALAINNMMGKLEAQNPAGSAGGKREWGERSVGAGRRSRQNREQGARIAGLVATAAECCVIGLYLWRCARSTARIRRWAACARGLIQLAGGR